VYEILTKRKLLYSKPKHIKNKMNTNHEKLAKLWIQYNGQKVTEKRLALTMKTSEMQLERMLNDRKVI
jgi:hypothetical protein